MDSFDRITTWPDRHADRALSTRAQRGDDAGQLLQADANAMQRNATLQLQDGSGWSCSPVVGHMMSNQKGRFRSGLAPTCLEPRPIF